MAVQGCVWRIESPLCSGLLQVLLCLKCAVPLVELAQLYPCFRSGGTHSHSWLRHLHY
jgi:hypothetical protein